ncbi:hypothetical protein BDN70DRAFT_879798 [Pholiota conissans]|uniref:Pali-domain-containing protein n=1 Tax=Pholiota conissans TaxID=109636 RepID=A0A9P6CST6_9AGAR|nr:hypothetical protein BDN70DRAFT_879798 [Pholiota conissans]
MARKSSIPGIALVLVALILGLLVTLSLPFLLDLDIVRINIKVEGFEFDQRLGIWSTCMHYVTGYHTCSAKELGYETYAYDILEPGKSKAIPATWTRGLVLHPIATAFTLTACLISLFSTNLIALFATLFATIIATTAFIIDIALYAHVHSLVKDVDIGGVTRTSAGFWLSFASVVLLIAASVTFFVGRRKENKQVKDTGYPLQSPRDSGRHWADKFQQFQP